MLDALLLNFVVSANHGLLNAALSAAEAPKTLRAAFTVSLESADATHIYSFDPRRPEGERWQRGAQTGRDAALDEVAANWRGNIAPDSWLFPDDLRSSLSNTETAEALGPAWRIRYDHQLSANDDSALDEWAAQSLSATAWIDPISERFLRIDHELEDPVRGPSGGRLTRFQQTYLLETDPIYGVSYVAAFAVDLSAKAGFRNFERRYEAQVLDVTFFFSSPAAEWAFLKNKSGNGAEDPTEERRIAPSPLQDTR
ncbi:MAG: hypothetical protein AAGJ32_11795 [Pseudomonadota bacterium]